MAKTGQANVMWKGDAAGYDAMHKRVAVRRGQPSSCEICGTTDPERVYDWANLTGRFEDPDDYARMCRSCHRLHDGAPSGEQNGNHKLSWDDVHEIRARWRGDWACARELAAIFGVTAQNIRHVATRATWRD